MKKEDVDIFEKNQAQLEVLYTEISNLAKKTPNDSVNKFKLTFINEVLASSNKILINEYMPFATFEQFDYEEMPSNSDVAFILSQYLSCLEKLRADNIIRGLAGYWYWTIDGKESNIRTSTPQKLK